MKERFAVKTYVMMALTALVITAVASTTAAAACGGCPAMSEKKAGADPAMCAVPDKVQAAAATEGRGPADPTAEQWARCGAFCHAGQVSPGWPHGWDAQYWLRPDSNL